MFFFYQMKTILGREINVNLYKSDIFDFNFQSLEVVSRYRDPQLKDTEIT